MFKWLNPPSSVFPAPPVPPRLTSHTSSKISCNTHHQRNASKHSVQDLTAPADNSPYSSLAQASIHRHNPPRPYHIDLDTLSQPSLKPAKRFSVSSIFPIRRATKEKSRSSKKGCSSVVTPVTIDDHIPPPPPPLLSPDVLPPPPPSIDVLSEISTSLPPDTLPPSPECPYSSVLPRTSRATSSIASLSRATSPPVSSRPVSGVVTALDSFSRPLSTGVRIDPKWSVEFEGRMRTLSQNKLALIEQQKGSKFYGDVSKP